MLELDVLENHLSCHTGTDTGLPMTKSDCIESGTCLHVTLKAQHVQQDRGTRQMTAGTDQGLLELTALLGVPYPQLDSWLEFDLPSLPQLPQQWPSEEEEEEPQHGSGSLINLAAFAAADAGQVSHATLACI